MSIEPIKAERWALRPYNEIGGYAPKMVPVDSLPDPDSRVVYVLESDFKAELESLRQDVEKHGEAVGNHRARMEALAMALLLVLDHVDYTSRACALNEMVGAVLPVQVIEQARRALRAGQ